MVYLPYRSPTYTELLHHLRMKNNNTEPVPKGFKSKTGKGGNKPSQQLREGEALLSKPLRGKKGKLLGKIKKWNNRKELEGCLQLDVSGLQSKLFWYFFCNTPWTTSPSPYLMITRNSFDLGTVYFPLLECGTYGVFVIMWPPHTGQENVDRKER